METKVGTAAHPRPTGRPEAWHRLRMGGVVGDLVLGSSDGLVAVLAFVAGVSASLGSRRAVLLAGLAEMFAGATSMGVGAYLASKSEREYYERELTREKREIQEMPHEEREEIRQIYRKKGFSGAELEIIVERITEDRERWLQVMMSEELGLTKGSFIPPLRAGLTVALSYILGSFAPIAPYLFLSPPAALWISAAATLLVLFVVGAVKASLTHRTWWRSGLEMALLGGLGAVVCYGISKLVAGL